jgi:predicted dehydrogenase
MITRPTKPGAAGRMMGLRPARFGLFAVVAAVAALLPWGCTGKEGSMLGANASVRLVTLDPGHFTAILMQKSMYPEVDSQVDVFAPVGGKGSDLEEHLSGIERFNTRADSPTHWHENVYTGPDFLQKMAASAQASAEPRVVIIAGNNAKKADYILSSIQGGLNVLADKPMAITPADFTKLQQAFDLAARKHLLLQDIMTERFEITTILQRELSMRRELFGTLVQGTADNPAITKESVHHFSKLVAGVPLRRPMWAFDVRQQGEGIVDVSTHLVDLIQWEGFPERPMHPEDVTMISARRWATPISRQQFEKTTGAADFPDFLKPDVKDGMLQVYANGAFVYRLRGVYAKVSVTWNYEAPAGGGDLHHSEMHGTQATLIIRQGAPQHFKPVLYIEKAAGGPNDGTFEARVKSAIAALQPRYPGIGAQRDAAGWVITIPEHYDIGHEAHFAQVMRNYLRYLRAGRLPAWETPNMLTKYATIMKAYEMSR